MAKEIFPSGSRQGEDSLGELAAQGTSQAAEVSLLAGFRGVEGQTPPQEPRSRPAANKRLFGLNGCFVSSGISPEAPALE